MSSLVSNLEVQIRKEVEQVLRKHVRRLSGVTHELSNVFLSLDMLTLTTTVLLVERENEISQSLEDERYNDNSLLKSLSELGLNQDREIKRTLQIMEQKKYFDILEDKTYHPLEVATKLTSHINSIFPQMPGLNLIVYFNQIIDEVLSNRKTVELAVAQIDKTLQTQGASKFKAKGKTKHKPKSKGAKGKSSLASMLKRSKRFSSLNRLKKAKTAPPKPPSIEPAEKNQVKETPQPAESIEEKAARIVTDDLGNFVANDVEAAYSINPDEIGAGVTDPQALADIFTGSADQQVDTFDRSDEISQSDIIVDTEDTDDDENFDSNAQSYADQMFQSFQKNVSKNDSPTEEPKQVSDDENEETEDDDNVDEEDVIEEEDEIEINEEEEDDDDDGDEVEDDEDDEEEEEEEEDDDDDDGDEVEDDEDDEEEEEEEEDDDDDDGEDDEIKRQIDEMNESLRVTRGIRQKSQEALNCPLCHQETIVELETSSHKTYYSCNNDDCKFISWDKPIDHKCPNCENPFLIEVEKDDKAVYQCPNKNCDYQINKDDVTDETFLTPLDSTKAESQAPEKKKKRKKRVRKVRVRRK
jgi:hypothetical protein